MMNVACIDIRTHDMQIWSVTIVQELSLTFFQHVLKCVVVEVEKLSSPD